MLDADADRLTNASRSEQTEGRQDTRAGSYKRKLLTRAGTVSNLNQKVYVKIKEWRQRSLLMQYPYVYLDGIYLKRNWGGNRDNVAVLVALAVNEDGQREVIGAAEGIKEDQVSWKEFLNMTHLETQELEQEVLADPTAG